MSDCDVSAMEEYMASPPREKGVCCQCNQQGESWRYDPARNRYVSHCDQCGHAYTVSDEEVHKTRSVPWWDAA